MRLSFRLSLLTLLLSATFVAAQDASPSTAPAAMVPFTPPTTAPVAPPGTIRVACIGDSITYGHNIKDREHDAYPPQLAKRLGDKYFVVNFGVNGTTALREGDRPYFKRPIYAKVMAYKADIAVIGLGTNDTKPQNWDSQHDAFVADYEALIADLKQANPDVKIYINLPPPCFLPGDTSIRDKVITDEVIPALKQIATDEKAAGVVDLHAALAGKADWFPDRIHPNEAGAAVMADAVARKIQKP